MRAVGRIRLVPHRAPADSCGEVSDACRLKLSTSRVDRPHLVDAGPQFPALHSHAPTVLTAGDALLALPRNSRSRAAVPAARGKLDPRRVPPLQRAA